MILRVLAARSPAVRPAGRPGLYFRVFLSIYRGVHGIKLMPTVVAFIRPGQVDVPACDIAQLTLSRLDVACAGRDIQKPTD